MRCAWALLGLVGCSDETAPPFHYIASERIDQTTRALVDRHFESFADALAEPAQTFELTDGVTTRTIELSIGVCRDRPCLGGVVEETVVLMLDPIYTDGVGYSLCRGTEGLQEFNGIDGAAQGACDR